MFQSVESALKTLFAGMFSRGSGKDGSRLSACSSRASSASMPPSAKTECEILQSANVKVFSYNDLRLATRNFRPDSVLGEGGFGSVYKGWIDEHTLSACKPGTGIPVAVKRLNLEGLQGHREWLVSITAIPFLAVVLGCHFSLKFTFEYRHIYVMYLNSLVTASKVQWFAPLSFM